MFDNLVRYIAHSKFGRIIQSTPVISNICEKLYRWIQIRQERSYIDISGKHTELTLPEIGEFYFEKCSLNYKEIIFIKYIFDHVSKDDTILDIGANVGSHSIPFSNHYHVIAFEPVKANLDIFRKNIDINSKLGTKAQPINIYEVALSNQEKVSEFKVEKESNHDNGRTAEASFARGGETDSVPVKMTKLDNIDIVDPDAMKIDIEGSELNMLKGAEETIERHQPDLFIEIHPEKMKAFGHTEKELYQFLHSKGYINNDVISHGNNTKHVHFSPGHN